MYKSIFIAVMVGLFSGCASMSKQECKAADWYLIGLGDAEKGQPKVRLDDHRKACAKAGVTPNLYQYEAGHERGLKTYCTTPNGYAVAVNGGVYQGICRGFAAEDFLRGYNDGRELYVARSNVEQVHRDIYNFNSEIDRIHRDVADYERRLIASDTSPQQRYDYLNRIKELQRNLGQAEANLRNAQRDSYGLEQDLRAVERKHQGFGY